MSRKFLLSVSMLVLAAGGVMCAAPQAGAQVFVGTPTPQQFARQGKPSTQNGEWFTNGADVKFTRYSPLDQINASNFGKLEVAWRFKTDALITSFADNGVLDIKVGVQKGNNEQIDLEAGEIGIHAAPTVTGDVVIVGSSMREGATVPTHNNTKGVVRAFDVRSGKQLWRFNTIPRPGEFGNETWENNSWVENGNTGVWAHITVDEELGLVYIPVETPSSDYYGGHRPGANLFAESMVAVDLKTGVRKWHFQFVHHPIWNWDMTSAPILADINVNGRPVKAVSVASKQGWLYVFDRTNGQPVWPIEERPVPQSDVPGEKTSPTQPVPP